VGVVGGAILVQESKGSDHQQTALTELNPRLDLTDVFVFPGSSDDRIVLAVTLASPIVGTQAAFFDPNALYQIKVDNNQDGREDLVFQFSFDQLLAGGQTVDVIGPVAPRAFSGPGNERFPGPASGAFGLGGVRDGFSTAAPVIRGGAANTVLTGNLTATPTAPAGQIQAWVGVRDDPFYIDLDQFFRIIPDRRPTVGPLSRIGTAPAASDPVNGRATAFRARCTTNAQGEPIQGAFITPTDPFDSTRGCARDFLRGFNALAIVVELPVAHLRRAGNTGPLGIFATISR
jgi:hypothetical protein